MHLVGKDTENAEYQGLCMRMQLLIAAAQGLASGNMLVAVTVNMSMEGYGRRSGADKVSKWVNLNQDVRDTLTEVPAGLSSSSRLQTFLKGTEKAWKVRIGKPKCQQALH